MKFRVTKRYERGNPIPIASMDDLNDAKLFINAKVSQDQALKVKIIYCVEEYGEVIAEFDSEELKTQSTSTDDSSQSRTSTSAFKPTPFNTSPTPPGLPKKWIHDEDDKNDKDKS